MSYHSVPSYTTPWQGMACHPRAIPDPPHPIPFHISRINSIPSNPTRIQSILSQPITSHVLVPRPRPKNLPHSARHKTHSTWGQQTYKLPRNPPRPLTHTGTRPRRRLYHARKPHLCTSSIPALKPPRNSPLQKPSYKLNQLTA